MLSCWKPQRSKDFFDRLGSPPMDVTLTCSCVLYSLSNFDLEDNSFVVEISFKLHWEDRRIAQAHSLGYEILSENLWRPEYKILDIREEPVIRDDVVELIDVAAGKARRYFRVQAKVKCFYNLRKFPFDDQIMQIVVRFPRHSTQGIRKLEQDLGEPEIADDLDKQLAGTTFDLDKFTFVCRGGRKRTLESSSNAPRIDRENQKLECVVEIKVKRRAKFYMWIIGIPNFLCCLFGFGAFLIDQVDYSARLSHIGSLMLTAVTVRFTVRLPDTRYLTMLDHWLLTLFFVLMAIALEASFAYSARSLLGPSDVVFEILFAFALLFATIVTSAMVGRGYGGPKSFSLVFLVAMLGWLFTSLYIASDVTQAHQTLSSWRSQILMACQHQ